MDCVWNVWLYRWNRIFFAKINNILYRIFASEAEKERQPYKVNTSYIKFLHRHVREGRTNTSENKLQIQPWTRRSWVRPCLSVNRITEIFMRLHGMVGRNPETSRLDSEWPWPKIKVTKGSTGKTRFANNSVQIRRRDSQKKIKI